jgi:hypothetical protein
MMMALKSTFAFLMTVSLYQGFDFVSFSPISGALSTDFGGKEASEDEESIKYSE